MGSKISKFQDYPWAAFLQCPMHIIDDNSYIENDELFVFSKADITIKNDIGTVYDTISIKYNITKNILFPLTVSHGLRKDKLNYESPICLDNIEFLYTHHLLIVADVLNAINKYNQGADVV